MACKKKQVIRNGAFLIQAVCISSLLMVVDIAGIKKKEVSGWMKWVSYSAELKESDNLWLCDIKIF